MDNSIDSPFRGNVVAIQTTPRPTQSPVRVQFSDVLAGGVQALVRGAQAAVSVLPGNPIAAVAVRGGTQARVGSLATLGGVRALASNPSGGVAPEGPRGVSGAVGLTNIGGISAGIGSAVAGSGVSGASDGGIESTMAQAQEMNLYYLQVQEEVNAQNRTFTALSNVLEVEHNTAKSAIGNIH